MIGGSAIRVTGLDRTMRQLAKEIVRIKAVSKAGLIKSGFLILRESNKIVPRELSNLAASGFVTWTGYKTMQPRFKNDNNTAARMGNDHSTVLTQEKAKLSKIDPQVEVGYSAYYAVYVHEDLNAGHKPGKEAKFLEKAVDRNLPRILQAVRSGGTSP